LKKSSSDASCSAVTRERFFFSIAGASWGEDGPADDVDARLRELADERMERRGPCCGTAWGLAAAAWSAGPWDTGGEAVASSPSDGRAADADM
jgi:hypothetical protein